jgi:hypothetical protein
MTVFKHGSLRALRCDPQPYPLCGVCQPSVEAHECQGAGYVAGNAEGCRKLEAVGGTIADEP